VGCWDRERLNRREGHRASSLERRAFSSGSLTIRDTPERMESEHVKVYCGIDWAEKHHDIALVDADGQLVAKQRIKETVEGFAELVAMLVEAGDNAEDPIPVAIETPRGLLVAALRASGRPVYPINPMAVARYRERHSVSRKKSDHVDAMTLAHILRTDAHLHRPLPADSELARAIAVLARAHQDATWRRTKAGNELRSLLREYYPGFLEAFAGGNATNLAHADARVVLAIAPTPAAAAKLTKARITAALRRRGSAPGCSENPFAPDRAARTSPSLLSCCECRTALKGARHDHRTDHHPARRPRNAAPWPGHLADGQRAGTRGSSQGARPGLPAD
jgi:hypothetical protein